MEHPALRLRRFSNLPLDIQLDILHRINSRLAIQKIRSASREFRLILPDPPPHQHLDMVIPFFNNNGEVLSTAVLRTYEVFNCRDGGWIIQVNYNLQEAGHFVRLMHPLIDADFESEFLHHVGIFDPVEYDTIEMPASYCLSVSDALEYREIAFHAESIWTLLENFMILMIWREDRLALYRSIDQTWGIIHHVCVDVICFDRDFYALESTGRTFMVHADRTTEEVAGLIIGENGHKKRLVESGGDLLLVDQYYHNPNEEDVNFRRTSRFVVFRFAREENTWVRIHTLGERVLFVGYYNRFSAAALDVAGARGDLIYFSEAFALDDEVVPENDNAGDEDDIHGPGRDDVGIFDMVDGRVTELGDPAAAQFAACFWPPPAWTANAAV